MTHSLERCLLDAARAPSLLVATDFDGTLAPIVADPAAAVPRREAMVALEALAALPQTHVAILSGRSLRELARLTGGPAHVHLVGSHGSEFDPGFADTLSAESLDTLEELTRQLEAIAADHAGCRVECKPASVAFHFRAASEPDASRVLEAVRSGPLARLRGVHVKEGKKVLELAVVETDKGRALDRLRHRLGVAVTIFLGDDVTDEDAFATLRGSDLGVKVGAGATVAPHRIEDPDEAARLLARLSELRFDWLSDSQAERIERHALLTDQRGAALVTPSGRITWLCVPRPDSPALLAELLGGPTAGHFTVEAADSTPPQGQRYLDDTFVLETRWPGFRVVDYMDASGGRSTQRPGRSDLVRVVEGTGRVRLVFAPRVDFGREATRLKLTAQGAEIEGTHHPVVLRAPNLPWQLEREGPHDTAVTEVDLDRTRPLVLELRHGTGSLAASVIPESERRLQTLAHWSSWAQRLVIPAVEPELVRRSALVLRALVHGPTGAILAAPTTSLPEHVGGVRNWDYRYCWLRDAAMAAASLVQLHCHAEAMDLLDWILGVLDECVAPERLSPVYTVSGAELPPEAEISELSGHRGSRPVRVGNAASRQVQLDVFGPVVDLVHLVAERGAPLSSEHWRLVEAMVHAVEKRWEEPDHGIWEIRDARRHHVHSKAMCWLTVDRAVRVGRRFMGRERPAWEGLRDAIAADVLGRGWNAEIGSYAGCYGGGQVDAAVLELGLRGLLAADDRRLAATVERVQEELRSGATVYRYRHEDGLPGREGGFHLCTGWLVRALLLVGRVADAEALFRDLIELVGPTGLLSEQWDPEAGRGLGNHPQGYSHSALIDAAVALDRARP